MRLILRLIIAGSLAARLKFKIHLIKVKKFFVIIFMDYLIKYSINFKSIFDELVVLNLERPYSWGKNMSNS